MRFWKRHDEAVPVETRSGRPVLTDADVKKAYDRGRRDERARRRSHPILALVITVAALMGAGLTVLAAKEGSFARGGQVVDHKLVAAAGQAQIATQQATDKVQQAAPSTGGDAGATANP
ncbi:MAG: hypothetical protein WDM92_05010 [Caulobacteraceae bacterium]